MSVNQKVLFGRVAGSGKMAGKAEAKLAEGPATTNGDPRRVGGRYWCGYWRQEYEVLKIETSAFGVRRYTIRWSDGKVVEHGTAWNWKRDRVMQTPEQAKANGGAGESVAMKLHKLREAALAAVKILERIQDQAGSLDAGVLRELARDAVTPLRHAAHK